MFTYLILIHELGHIVAGIYFNWTIKEIIILPFGGLTKFEVLLNKPINEELIITLMGPLFQILGFYLLNYKLNSEVLLFYNNIILAFNLIPIIPLDGSKIFLLTLQKKVSFYKSYKILLIFSCIFFIFLILLNSLIFRNVFLFVTLLLLHKHIYKVYKEYTFYFKKFLLERYLYKLYFKKHINLNEASLKRMKRDCKHLFYYKNKYVTEKEMLYKTFCHYKLK